jgi:2-polyprenyl-3-methyl-5-hydroxy-6-metoxy-1,4-benzoquinol methylase
MNPFAREHYDKIYKDSEKYYKHYSKSVYYIMWRKVMSHLTITKPILDLGCGTGQFAEMIHDFGFTHYTGIDFSAQAIGMAKDLVPKYTWIESDLFDFDYSHYDNATIVATETFEHIDDLSLIQQLPKTKIVFSVPNFMADNHYRVYTSEKQIRDYYKGVIDIKQVDMIQVNAKAVIFVCKGTII